MDLVAGAVGSIIGKLGELLHGEYRLQKGLPEQIKYLNNELVRAHTALCMVGATPPEHLDPPIRLWARELKEASYDMEDILDAFHVDVVEGAAPLENKDGLLKHLKKKMTTLLKKSKARHDIASAIEDMKKRLQEVWDRRERYSVPVAAAAPAAKLDPRRRCRLVSRQTVNGTCGTWEVAILLAVSVAPLRRLPSGLCTVSPIQA